MFDLSQDTSWLTSPYREIESVGKETGSILVIPVGSVEQHGHHLPVGTDSLLVSAVVNEAAGQVDDLPLLETPVVWPGFSPHHLSLGGTLSVEHDTLLSVLSDIAQCGLRSGFDGIAFVNGHGGNKPLIATARSVVGETAPQAEVLDLTYFDLAVPYVDELRDSDSGGMSHGGEFETSLMLHCYPELVADERPATPHEEPYDRGLQDMFDASPVGVYRRFEFYADSGAIGRPDLATAKKGAALFDAVTDELEAVFREMVARGRRT